MKYFSIIKGHYLQYNLHLNMKITILRCQMGPKLMHLNHSQLITWMVLLKSTSPVILYDWTVVYCSVVIDVVDCLSFLSSFVTSLNRQRTIWLEIEGAQGIDTHVWKNLNITGWLACVIGLEWILCICVILIA